MKRKINYFLSLSFLSLFVSLSGCSVIYKSTGELMVSYAEDQGVPYMLASKDVALGCSMTEAFTPFLLSFSRVTTSPDQLAILLYLMAGNCIEMKAWQEELRYLRAVHAKNSTEAQDARIAQQRLLAQAAHRQLVGYRHLTLAIAEPGGECPEFVTEREELYWLMGLLDGLQAVMNDIASGGAVEVPMDIGSKVGRAATCLDNEKWWGVPNAIQSAIRITIPGKKVDESDPEEVLKSSLTIGLQQGVIIAQVLAAQVYLGQGKIEQVKQVIRSHAGLISNNSKTQEYKVLNEISRLQIQAISDRLWTEATGKRTPIGKVGTFWDDPDKLDDAIDIDEIL